MTSPTIPYIEKLIKLVPILQSLLEPAVNFNTDFELVSLEDYTDMITCLGLNNIIIVIVPSSLNSWGIAILRISYQFLKTSFFAILFSI